MKTNFGENMNREDMVKEFHVATNSAVGLPFSAEMIQLRGALISEEAEEVLEELDALDFLYSINEEANVNAVASLLKELADLQYVLSGTAVAFGLPLDEAFTEVHRSNMSKLGDDGKALFREDGKVLKGPNYRAPDLSSIAQAWIDRFRNSQAESSS